MEGELVQAGEFDFEIALLANGLATLAVEKIPDLHPRARDELLAYLAARGEVTKTQRERWEALNRR